MALQEIVESQYYAALEMLKEALNKCPENRWNPPEQKNKFWHVAFHTLFYTHLYLQPSEGDFTPWEKHQPHFTSLSEDPTALENLESGPGIYTKEDLLEYVAFCQEEVTRQLGTIDFHAESGFYWLPFNKMEVQLYNIRHIQHHTGELYQQLSDLEDQPLDWVGMKR
jgi:hypothetical protein